MTKRISPFTAPGGGNQAKAHVYFFNNATPSTGALVAVSTSTNTADTIKYTIANEQGLVSSDQRPLYVAESVTNLWAATRTGGTEASPTWSSSVACTLVSDQYTPPDNATYAPQASTPTIGELFVDSWVTAGPGVALSTLNNASVPLFTAPFPLVIKQVALLSWSGDANASDTNYISATLRRYRAGVTAQIAVKTTKATGGASWLNRNPWSFDAVALDPANQVFQQYDVLGLFIANTGTPGDPTGVRAMVRYEPQ